MVWNDVWNDVEDIKHTDMDDNFSPRVKDVISFSKEEALRLGHDYIGTEHLMLGILRDGGGKAISILTAIDVDLDNLRKKVEILNPALLDNTRLENTKRNLHLTRQAERALKTTFLEAKLFQSDLIDTHHLLLCILRNENDPTTKLLERLNVNYDLVKEEFKSMLTNDSDYLDISGSSFSEESEDNAEDDKQNPYIPAAEPAKSKKSKTPVLDNFGKDITALAALDKLDPIVGREKEIERVSQILESSQEKQSALDWRTWCG